MRQWRVGTVSMALSLILAGIALFVSQVLGMAAFDTLIAWWPLVFVLLGVEILLHVWFSRKQEQPVVRYDFLSILFVGLLGSLGLLMTMLTSVGVLGELRHAVAAQERTLDLPEVRQPVPDGVKRIVVEADELPVRIEGNELREIRLWGSYRTDVVPGEETATLADSDLVAVRTVGDAMYLSLKDGPGQSGLFRSRPDIRVTLLLPRDVQVEVRGGHGPLELNPGAIRNHWSVSGGGSIALQVPAESDIRVSTVTLDPPEGDIAWTRETRRSSDAGRTGSHLAQPEGAEAVSPPAAEGPEQTSPVPPVDSADEPGAALPEPHPAEQPEDHKMIPPPPDSAVELDEQLPGVYRGELKTGKGTWRIHIVDSVHVSVRLVHAM